MPIRFEWFNAEKTILRYVIEGEWNWHDYHRVVRISLFQMMQHKPRSVHSLLDFSGSTRAKMPSGLTAHSRTFGKRGCEALTGHGVLIGIPHEAYPQLLLDDQNSFETEHGRIYVVDTLEEATTRLATL